MGVRLLQTFISREVKDGLIGIDIAEEIEKYKRENNGQSPTIVIDQEQMHQVVYQNNHEILVGGRYNVYNNRAIAFFEKFKSLGVNLVFFKDGPLEEHKLLTALNRRNVKYEKALNGLNLIYNEQDLSEASKLFEIQDPKPFFGNFTKLVRKYGECYVATLNDGDCELAEYATRNNVLAIISNDSDFLIYEGDWHFWSSTHFDIVNFRTKEYNRKALLDTLGLKSDQMAIFSTMCGNDVIPYDTVKEFHRVLKHPSERYHFRVVALQVKLLGCSRHTITQEKKKTISNWIFPRKQAQDLELIEMSLNLYDYTTLRTEHDNPLLASLAMGATLIYMILQNIKHIIQLFYFDLSKQDLMPYSEIVLPFIRRLMGILLQHENNPSVTRTLYFKLRHNTPYESVKIRPEYPSYAVPPILELLYEPFETNKNLDELRFQLLCWQLSRNLKPDMIQNLPSEGVLHAVTLFYLVELKQISINEADCLLLANYCPDNLRESLQLADYNQINERDARIAFLFTNLEVDISNCFKGVGLKHLLNFTTLDGLYFHSLRRNWDEMNENDKMFELSAYKDLRIYN